MEDSVIAVSIRAGEGAERNRIRLLALKEAEKSLVPGSEGSGDCRKALLYFASLLEDR